MPAGRPAPTASTWRRVRMTPRAFAQALQQRHRLRLHGWCIGSFTLALMLGIAALQKALGVDSLALRYLVTLGVGYLAYLLVLRWWAARLVQPEDAPLTDTGAHVADVAVDVADVLLQGVGNAGRGTGPARVPLPRSGGGGDFGGGGAEGGWSAAEVAEWEAAGTADAGSGLGDMAGGALEAAGSADEASVVVVPVVAIFLIGAALCFGAGALALLYFGSEVLLAVALELAFSVATARVAMGVERAGWLAAAVRLTWKPLLGALLCAVVLGGAIDVWLPQAHSLPEAVRLLRGR